MLITLSVLAVAVVLFVSEKIRSDLVALCALLALMLFGILTPAEALSGFSNPVIIMMIGLFVVSGAIFQTGLAKMISSKLMKLAGKSQVNLYILIMLVTSIIGAFVSNTGTVALMIPIVVGMAAEANVSPSRFLMPLAFASSLGGMMTLIGTPPNLVINETLIKGGFDELSFFSFLPVGLICVALGTLALAPLSKMFLSKETDIEKKEKGKSLKDLANEYQLSQNLFRVCAKKSSLFIGKQLHELEIPQKYHLNILEIRRRASSSNPFFKTINQKVAGPETSIEINDVLYVSGAFEMVKIFVSENNLELIDLQTEEKSFPRHLEKLRFDEIGIAEVVLLPDSSLVGRQVKNSGFREKYKVNILGIQRRKEYILQNLKEERMLSGDVLLVQGEWTSVAHLSEEQTEWVVIGQPLTEASKVTLSHKAPLAAAIMIFMILAMAFNIVPTVTAAMIAAVLIVLTGCFRNVEDAYKTINWQSVVLIGSMLPMSVALEKTGVSEIVSTSLVTGLGRYGPLVLLAGIYFSTSLLTLFISNTATAVLFAPIALYSALAIGVSPYPFLFAVTVAASMCFSSPFSTPPNAIVMSAGKYTFGDYIKVGLPLQILFGIVMVLVLPLLFPFK